MKIIGARSSGVVKAQIATVVVLWTLLAALVVPNVSAFLRERAQDRAPRDLAQIGTGLGDYQVDHGSSEVPSPLVAEKRGELDEMPAVPAEDADVLLAGIFARKGAAVPSPAAVPSQWDPPDPADEASTDDPEERALGAARELMSERDRIEGLSFLDPRGLWRNTYRPRDPELCFLATRTEASPRSDESRLETLAHRATMPFDPPEGAAIALYAAADRRVVQDPCRLLLQVGLTGTSRKAGSRSPIRLCLVMDLRGKITRDQAELFRALALSLARSQDAGDRFFLVVAGRPGAVSIEPQSFGYGFVKVTLDRLFAGAPSDSAALDLPSALALAGKCLAAGGEVTRLGGSEILLATSQPLSELDRLTELAHRSALSGASVSVAAIGPGTLLAEIDRIALAGQGNVRRIDGPSDTDDAIALELRATGRIVARSLRLSIRLAPSVKLVEVVGSEPVPLADVGEANSGQEAIEARVVRELGIPLPKGSDDDGIQIFVPAFASGDAHAILLDLVVPGPGDVADVTVRYQDLVWMRNGVGRCHLALGRGSEDQGPLQVAVLKGYLAYRVGAALASAGRDVEGSRTTEAAATLARVGLILEGAPGAVPALARDRDLADDISLLQGFGRRLGMAAEDPKRIAASLRYVAMLKTVPRPA